MIANCLCEDTNFDVVLIYKGEETQSNSDIHSVGTIARIYDWQHRNDGLLGITALGMHRFEIENVHPQVDGLTIATINLLDDEGTQQTSNQYPLYASITSTYQRTGNQSL